MFFELISAYLTGIIRATDELNFAITANLAAPAALQPLRQILQQDKQSNTRCADFQHKEGRYNIPNRQVHLLHCQFDILKA